MEDWKIIELYWARKEEALRETEIKYGKFCFGIAWNILYNREDSEECVNDTWLAAWNSIPPKRPSFFSSFLGRLTRNFAIDCFRKKSAGKRVDRHMADIVGELEKIETTVADLPEDSVMKKDLIKIINQFLDTLKFQYRDIFIRRYWYMDPVKKIAKRHGYSESKVKSSLFRSRRKLLEHLRRNGYE